MRIIRQFFAGIILLVAIPLFMLAACNSALNAAVFNPNTYEEAFADPLLFDDLLNVALPAILQAAEENVPEEMPFQNSPVQLAELSEELDEATWREVTTLLIPPAWLQARADQLLESLSNIVTGDYSTLENSFELEVIHQRLTGEEAAQAATLIITESTRCSRTEEAALEAFHTSGEGTLPICNPSTDALRERSITTLIQWLNAIGTNLEATSPTISTFFDFTAADARQLTLLAQLNQQLLQLMYILPAALLALVVVLAVRSLRSFSRWVGISLLVTGMLILVFLLILQASVIGAFGDLIRPTNQLEAFASRLLLPLLRAGLAQASGVLLLQAVIFVGVSFVIMAYAWLDHRNEPESQDSGEYVLLTADGRVISSTQRQIGTITPTDMQKK